MKKCTACEVEKDDNEFEITRNQCNECRALYMKKYNQENWNQRIVENSRVADLKKWNADEIEDFGEYLTGDRVSNLFIMQKGECFYDCDSGKMEVDCDRKKNPNGVTVERINNAVPHAIENCVLVHHRCNTIRSDGASFDFMMKNAKKLRRHFHKRKLVNMCKTCLRPCKKISCGSHYNRKNHIMRMSYPTQPSASLTSMKSLPSLKCSSYFYNFQQKNKIKIKIFLYINITLVHILDNFADHVA